MRSRNKATYIIIGLIIIGVMSTVFANPSSYIIPIAIGAIVWFLYKFPPGRRKASSTKRGAKRKTKSAKFRVIQGNKRDDNDDETPRYH